MDWYPRYPAEMDRTTLGMTLAQRGMLDVLLDHYTVTGTPIRDDDSWITKTIGCSPESWLEAAPRVRPLFAVGDGYLRRPEIDRRIIACRKRLSGPVWDRLRAIVFERDGYCCVYCGSAMEIECDHRIPRIRGGNDDLTNLVTACKTCNCSKGGKLVEEWRQ